jgi:hypothetical protein
MAKYLKYSIFMEENRAKRMSTSGIFSYNLSWLNKEKKK